MPLLLVYTCGDCSFEHEVLVKTFSLGPLPDSLAQFQAHTQGFACDACQVMLTIPKDISVEAWRQWKANDPNIEREMEQYPFVAELVARIDHALELTHLSSLDVGPIDCPYCHLPLPSGDKIVRPNHCDRCEGVNLQLTGSGVASMKVGITWPPFERRSK